VSRTLYIPPHLQWALFGTVTEGGPSTLDSEHQLAWLVDGRPGFPLRLNSSSGVIQIDNSPKEVSHLAICHHLLPAGTDIDITGDLSGTVTIPPLPTNGVPLNGWTELTAGSPPDVSQLILTITGLSGGEDIVIGEVIAGKALELDPSFSLDSAQFGIRRYVNSDGGNELSGIPPYSEHARSRPFSGSLLCDASGLQRILDWFDGQDLYPYPVPSLLILDDADPTDARVVTLEEPRYTRNGPIGADNEFLVQLVFNEIPRTKW
jgi:hypothetical protein